MLLIWTAVSIISIQNIKTVRFFFVFTLSTIEIIQKKKGILLNGILKKAEGEGRDKFIIRLSYKCKRWTRSAEDNRFKCTYIYIRASSQRPVNRLWTFINIALPLYILQTLYRSKSRRLFFGFFLFPFYSGKRWMGLKRPCASFENSRQKTNAKSTYSVYLKRIKGINQINKQ